MKRGINMNDNNRTESGETPALQVPEQTAAKRTELAIEGMSCASCSAAVERAVKKLEGISLAQVNLATNTGSFAYDPSLVSLTEIKSAITNAGYTPKDIEGEKTRSEQEARRDNETGKMRIRLVIAAVFSAPILYIAMSHMFPLLGL